MATGVEAGRAEKPYHRSWCHRVFSVCGWATRELSECEDGSGVTNPVAGIALVSGGFSVLPDFRE